MARTVFTLRILVRACALVLIVLGVLFWIGRAFDLIGLHMLVGIVLVVVLWILAGLAIGARLAPGLVAFAFIWGLVVVALGMAHAQLLPGSAHWVIQVLHLLVGLSAVGLAETLGRRIVTRAPAAR